MPMNWYQEDRVIKPPKMVEIHYQVLEKMGEGGCGTVHRGKSLLNNAPVAIKFQSKHEVCGVDLLKNERCNYQILSGKKGIPRLYTWGKVDDDLSCLVLELLGETVHDRFSKYPRFGMKDVRDIAIQMLSRLETIHGEGLLWLDIKPQNMAYGRKGTRAQDILYSLDFGFMMPYIVNGRHIRQKITGDKFGTLRYMSRNMHRGKTPSRRDDMESLCYVLVYLAKRRLPWQGKVEDDGERAVYDLRKNIDPAKLCVGLPDSFYKFCKYVFALKFTDEPKYEMCRSFFTDMDRFEWSDSDSDDESTSSINQKPLSNGPTTKCNVGSATDKKPSIKDNTSPAEKCVSDKVSPKDSSPVPQAKTEMISSKKEHISPTNECVKSNTSTKDASPVPQTKTEIISSKKEHISPTKEYTINNPTSDDSSPIPQAKTELISLKKEDILSAKECIKSNPSLKNSSPIPPADTPTMLESQQTSNTNNKPSSSTDILISSVALRIEKLKLLSDDLKLRVGHAMDEPLFLALLVEIDRLYSDTKHKVKKADIKVVEAESPSGGNQEREPVMSPPEGCQDEGKEMSRRNVLIQTDDDRVVATKSDIKGDAVLPPEGCQDEGKETSRRNVLIQTDDDQVVATKNDIKGDAVLPLARMKEMNQSMDMENQEFQAAVTEAVDTDTKKRFVSRLARFISARKVWKKASTQDVAVQQLAQNESSCVLDCNTITEACEFGRAETQGLKSDRVKKAKKRGASARVKLFISKKIMRQKHSK